MKKTNFELADLLQNLSNAVNEREGRDSSHLDNDEYINGAKKAIPEIEKALNDLKLFLQDK